MDQMERAQGGKAASVTAGAYTDFTCVHFSSWRLFRSFKRES